MYTRFINYAVAAAAVAAIAGSSIRTSGQAAMQPTNDAPNPYPTTRAISSCPRAARGDRRAPSTSTRTASRSGSPSAAGRTAASIAPAGRCRSVDPVLKFDATGKLVKSFGAGMLIFPHGIHVDRDGNVWVTDGQDNAPLPRAAPAPDAAQAEGRRQVARRRQAVERRRAVQPAAGARRRPGRSARVQARPTAIRCSSSAPTASCC